MSLNVNVNNNNRTSIDDCVRGVPSSYPSIPATNKTIAFARPLSSQSTAGNVYDVTFPTSTGGVMSDKDVVICSVEECRSVVKLLIDQSVNPIAKNSADDDDSDTDNDDATDDDEQPLPMHSLALPKLALVSPRLMWSFAYHFPNHHLHAILQSKDFGLTGVSDWAFLETRSRKLSEKAKDNKRRKQETSKDSGKKDAIEEKAVEAVEDLEEAIMDRFEGTNSAVAALTPTLVTDDGWALTGRTSIDVKTMHECYDEDLAPDVLEQLGAMGVNNVWTLASADADSLPAAAREGVAHAQGVVVEEIVRRIVDGSEANYARLEAANVATVADLCMFEDVEDALVEVAGSGARVWVARAVKVRAMKGLEWLEDWTTV
jgi:hypothetical protein